MKGQGSDIGLIGLGVMVKTLVLNRAEHWLPVAVFNRTTQRTRDVIDKETCAHT